MYTIYETHDITDRTQVLDMSDIILKALEDDQRFVGMIPQGDTCEDVRVSWLEETLWPKYTLADTSGNYLPGTTETQLDLQTNEVNRLIAVNTVLKDVTKGEEVIVTADNVGGDYNKKYVARNWGGNRLGSSTAVAHLASAKWEIMFTTVPEASDPGDDRSRVAAPQDNAIHTFEYTLKVSRHQQKRKMVAVADFMAHQVEKRKVELLRDMTSAFIWSRLHPTDPYGAENSNRSMRGIIDYLAQTGGNYVSADRYIGVPLLNEMTEMVLVDGGDFGGGGGVVLTDLNGAELFSGIDADTIRRTPEDERRGGYVTTIKTAWGIEHHVVWDPRMHFGVLPLLDLSRIKRRAFIDGAFFLHRYDDGSDAIKCRALADWSLEVRDAKYAHAIALNIVG
jgi:hypothetical protein